MRHIREQFVQALFRMLEEYENYIRNDTSKSKARKDTDGYYLNNIRQDLEKKHLKKPNTCNTI